VDGWEDDAAAMLDRASHGPLAGAHVGTLRILSLTPPGRFGRYQLCRMRVELAAPDLEAEPLDTEVVLDKRFWPEVGAVVPARISRDTPRQFEADWDALAR
jgi:hypothetical protein